MDPAAIASVLAEDGVVETSECETTDIYLLPPHEDPETCTSWLRMRNRDGHYTLMFEETVCDADVMISPRIKFEVGVRIFGGLMALGYEGGAIMKRRSREWSDELLSVKVDWIEGLDRSFTQIQGKVRAAVVEAGSKLGLDGTYIPHSYIEQVQFEEMTEELRHMTARDERHVRARGRARRLYPPDPIGRTAVRDERRAADEPRRRSFTVGNNAQKASKGSRARATPRELAAPGAVRGRGRGGGGRGRRGCSEAAGSFARRRRARRAATAGGLRSRGVGSRPHPGPVATRARRARRRDGAPGGAFARGRPPVSPFDRKPVTTRVITWAIGGGARDVPRQEGPKSLRTARVAPGMISRPYSARRREPSPRGSARESRGPRTARSRPGEDGRVWIGRREPPGGVRGLRRKRVGVSRARVARSGYESSSPRVASARRIPAGVPDGFSTEARANFDAEYRARDECHGAPPRGERKWKTTLLAVRRRRDVRDAKIGAAVPPRRIDG